MKIFIAGASGRVASELVRILAAEGHEVTAGVRSIEKAPKVAGVRAVEFDLHASKNDLAGQIKGMDAVYFTAGSRGKDLLQTDAFGAVSLMQAAEQAGVSRFIMLSAIFADRPELWEQHGLNSIRNYQIAKYFADHWLMNNTNLDYTIVQPSLLEEAEEGSGKVTFNPDVQQKAAPNTIPNVAAVLAGVLEAKNTYRKLFWMYDGETPIAEAIAEL